MKILPLWIPMVFLAIVNGVLPSPHPYLLEVLQLAAQLSQKTGRAFDITVQPLYRLYADSAITGQLPTDPAIADTLTSVNWRQVKLTPGHVELHGKGTAITLNGIARGFASDAGTRVLQQYGIENALIDSGEISALGHRSDNRDWSIGIKQMEGFSLRSTFGNQPYSREVLYWEHEGNRAVRKGKWKLVSDYPGDWELYDMGKDRTETVNLAAENPSVVRELAELYSDWAERCQVMPLDQLLQHRKQRREAGEDSEP